MKPLSNKSLNGGWQYLCELLLENDHQGIGRSRPQAKIAEYASIN